MTEALHSVALSADVGSPSSALLQAAWGVFCLGTSTKESQVELPAYAAEKNFKTCE